MKVVTSWKRKHTEPRNQETWEDSMHRMSWKDICQKTLYRDRWVALDDCHYDESTGEATDGEIIDADEDLVELCNRIRQSDRKNCAILFAACKEHGDATEFDIPERTQTN